MLYQPDCHNLLTGAHKQCFVPLVEDRNANMRLLHLGGHVPLLLFHAEIQNVVQTVFFPSMCIAWLVGTPGYKIICQFRQGLQTALSRQQSIS